MQRMKSNYLPIEPIAVTDIIVEDGYNVRSDSELKANIKAINAEMERLADDHTHPSFRVRYIERNGLKYTRSHATLAAALHRDWKEVIGERVERDWAEDQFDLIASNNSAHPISRKQQGIVFKRLMEGHKEQNGEHEIVHAEPLNATAIAKRFGVSRQHVDDCILLAENPLFAEYEDKVSANVFILAEKLVNKHHNGVKSKLSEVLRAAIHSADGQRATPKHFEAIKEQFIPLKADTSSRSANGEQGEPATGILPHETKQAEKKGGDAPVSETYESGPESAAPTSDPEAAAKMPEQELIPAQVATQDNLSDEEERLFGGSVPAKLEAIFKRNIELIERWNDITLNTVSEEDVRRLASAFTLTQSPL